MSKAIYLLKVRFKASFVQDDKHSSGIYDVNKKQICGSFRSQNIGGPSALTLEGRIDYYALYLENVLDPFWNLNYLNWFSLTSNKCIASWESSSDSVKIVIFELLVMRAM